MLVTSIDVKGNSVVFGFPSTQKFPLIRIQPLSLYVSPTGPSKGKILMSMFPFKITKHQISKYLMEKEVRKYDVFYDEGVTLLVRENTIGNSNDAWRLFFCPVESFDIACARAIKVCLDPSTAYSDLALPFDGGLENLEQAALRGEIDWIIPVPDVTGNRPPVWLFRSDTMRIRVGIGLHTTESTARNKLILLDKKAKHSDKLPINDEILVMDPETKAATLNIAHYVDVPFDGEGFFEPGDPPIPDDKIMGRSFGPKGNKWTIRKSIPPIRWGQGWFYLVQRSDGVYGSITQRQLMVLAKTNWMRATTVGWSAQFDQAHISAMTGMSKSSVKVRCFDKGKVWIRVYMLGESGRFVLSSVTDYDLYRIALKGQKLKRKMLAARKRKAVSESKAARLKRKTGASRLSKLKAALKNKPVKSKASSEPITKPVEKPVEKVKPKQDRTSRAKRLRALKKKRMSNGSS